MERCRDELHGSRGEELRTRRPCYVPLHTLGQTLIDPRPEQRGHVEGRKDGEAIADGKQCVADGGDGPWDGAGGAEHADEDLVLVHAEADVGGTAGGELGGAGCDGGGGLGLHGRGGGVEGVGGEVGAAVEHADEGGGLGEDDGVGAEEQGAERGLERLREGVATRGVLHDGPVDDGDQGRDERTRTRRADEVGAQAQGKLVGVPIPRGRSQTRSGGGHAAPAGWAGTRRVARGGRR